MILLNSFSGLVLDQAIVIILGVFVAIILVIAFDKYANSLRTDYKEEAERALEYSNEFYKELAEQEKANLEKTKVNIQEQNKRLGI